MKFRGVMIDAIPMREFTHVIQTLSKISKDCTLRLTTDTIYFIISDDVSTSQSSKVWCQLDRASFFSQYCMEGVDETHRDIFLGFGTGNLARSLVSLKQDAKCFKIKLTNKQSPCLTLEIELPSANSEHIRQVIHDVPVSVVPRKSWVLFAEPGEQKYHISIVMPDLKQVRTTVEHMKNMSSELILKANPSGQLVLQIKTDMATVSSRFRNLEVKYFGTDSDTEDSGDEREDDFVICRIDIKRFAMFLSADQIGHSQVVCSMTNRKMVSLIIDNEGILNFKCFIPSISY